MQQFGKYRLLEPVASGGMADVFRAEAPGAEGFVKEVALKVIRGDHGGSSDFVRMFIQEARLASRLAHANVVQVFEFDQVDGRYYIAMEFVHGRTLRRVLDRCREAGLKLGLARCLQICTGVARALAYAHRLAGDGGGGGIVHRDVSPQNVLISFEGEVKLADFGIARAMGAAGLTEPGTIKGKVAYMAPEQARGEPVDARADIFSLGVVLWELCAGRRLFARESDAAALAAVIGSEAISPPSAWNEAVSEDLDAAVMRALERDAARRTGTAQELATALEAILLRLARTPEDLDLRALMHRLWPDGATPPSKRVSETTAVRAGPAPEAAGTAEAEASTRTAALHEARARRRRRRGALAAAALAVAAAAAMATHGPWARKAGTGEGSSAAEPARGPTPGPTASPSAASTPTPTAAPNPTANPTPMPAPAESSTTRPLGSESPLAAEVPAATPPPSPPSASRPHREARWRGSSILEASPGLNTLSVPAAATGEGILSVNAQPWGAVSVDGQDVGHTPCDVRVRAGKHRLHVEHPRRPPWKGTVLVKPGSRSTQHVDFKLGEQ